MAIDSNHHKVIAVLHCDCSVEIGKENVLGILEGRIHRRQLFRRHNTVTLEALSLIQ